MSQINKNSSLITTGISIVALIIGFSLGIFFQKGKTPTLNRNSSNPTQMIGRGQGQALNQQNDSNFDDQKNRGQVAGFRQTVGEITSLDQDSVTVKLTDGSSKIVFLSDATTINQSVSATREDLQVGTSVAIRGNQNTDGSLICENIEINPHVATLTPAN